MEINLTPKRRCSLKRVDENPQHKFLMLAHPPFLEGNGLGLCDEAKLEA
jgi:hypothetical protein